MMGNSDMNFNRKFRHKDIPPFTINISILDKVKFCIKKGTLVFYVTLSNEISSQRDGGEINLEILDDVVKEKMHK
jgi:hypothetical protein